MHISSKIEGRKHESLFKDLGFRGFPSLAGLDSSGALVARHSAARTIEGISSTLDAAQKYQTAKTNAAKGDIAAQQALLVADIGLGRYSFAQAELKLAVAVGQMPTAVRKQAEQALVTLQFTEMRNALQATLPRLTRAQRNDEEIYAAYMAKRKQYMADYYQLHHDFYAAGRIPGGYERTRFYTTLASSVRDASGLKLLDELEAKNLGPRLQRVIANVRRRIDRQGKRR